MVVKSPGPPPQMGGIPHISQLMQHCENYKGRLETVTTAPITQIASECYHDEECDTRWRTIDREAFAEGNRYGWNVDILDFSRSINGHPARPDNDYRSYLSMGRRKERDESYWSQV